MPKRHQEPRGGRHQRRKTKEGVEEESTWPSLGGLSPVTFRLLEKWSWGNSSALEICELARACQNTFPALPPDLTALASCGSMGHSPSNTQRDLLRQPAFKNMKAPSPYTVKAHCMTTHGIEMVELSIFLPHDWAECLARNNLMDNCVGTLDDCKQFWKQVRRDDPKLHNNPIVKENREVYMPFVLHADKGPHAKQDSLHTISMYSLVAQQKKLGLETSSFLLASIPNSCILTPKKLAELGLADSVEPTMDSVGKALAWSFAAWFAGKFPCTDQEGKPLGPERKEKAGSRICNMRCIVWSAPADCEHNSLEYKLPHHAADYPCMRCECDRDEVPWNDFTAKASWRKVCYTPEQLEKEPLTDHWLMSIPGTSHWTFAYDFMHCSDIGFAASAIANVFYDIVFKHLTGRQSKRISQLMELVKQGYSEVGIQEGRISRLTLSSFATPDAPHQNYPALLHSAIKAHQVSQLVPVAHWLCEKFKDDTSYSKHRLHCLKNLDKLYTITDQAGLFLSPGEFKDYLEATHRFLAHYEALSKISAKLTEKRVGQLLG